jgi:hypothetical protein
MKPSLLEKWGDKIVVKLGEPKGTQNNMGPKAS